MNGTSKGTLSRGMLHCRRRIVQKPQLEEARGREVQEATGDDFRGDYSNSGIPGGRP